VIIVCSAFGRTYKLLNVLEFSSARKRMSVIVKDETDGQIILLCKGADRLAISCKEIANGFSHLSQNSSPHLLWKKSKYVTFVIN
jgi:phospholipid-translocating ATPase